MLSAYSDSDSTWSWLIAFFTFFLTPFPPPPPTCRNSVFELFIPVKSGWFWPTGSEVAMGVGWVDRKSCVAWLCRSHIFRKPGQIMPGFILFALKTGELNCQNSISKPEAIFILKRWDGMLAKKWKNKIYNTNEIALCMTIAGEIPVEIFIAT